jgi:two-component system, OmpR family, sensor histidine kinase BaeS
VRARVPVGIGAQIAIASMCVAAVALVVVGAGVWVVGGQSFEYIMKLHGESTEGARQMFDEAVTRVLILAIVSALIVAVVLAVAIGSALAKPLRRLSEAARRVAARDYAARLPRTGSTELVSVADSFNHMATALEQQERIRREFIANAAHELRTPLTNLQGYLEALRDAVIQPDRQLFESLYEETDRLVRLSRSLDQLAAGDASLTPIRRDDIDISASIRSAVRLSGPAAAARDTQLIVRGPEGVHVLGDADRVTQILSNLLANAIQHGDRGGVVTVSWREREADVRISVENSGAPIPESELPLVFERFHRVDKSRDRRTGGAGIGLAIVSQLVESIGGSVGAESADGRTRFWFTVPIGG